MKAAYRFRLEEEYFLADQETGLSPNGDRADHFHAVAGDAIGAAEHEFLKGQVEIATNRASTLTKRIDHFRAARTEQAEIASQHGLKFFAATGRAGGQLIDMKIFSTSS